MHYAIVVEKAENNYSAYVPDSPGCAATGFTVEETEREIREAIEFHIEGLIEDGLPGSQQHQEMCSGGSRFSPNAAGQLPTDPAARAPGETGIVGRKNSKGFLYASPDSFMVFYENFNVGRQW